MMQSTFISQRIASLAEDAKSQQLDDETRAAALNAARDLVAALESPVEKVIQDVVLQNSPILMALRMGVQLGIFSQISQSPEKGVSCDLISESSKASPILVGQSKSIGWSRLFLATSSQTPVLRPNPMPDVKTGENGLI
ncbi:unnamed protein product [Penicillium pancosmium]